MGVSVRVILFFFAHLLLVAQGLQAVSVAEEEIIGRFPVEYHYDADKRLDISAVMNAPFTQAESDLYLHPASGAHWIRFDVTNSNPYRVERFVSYSRNILSTLDFYELDALGKLRAHDAAGMDVPPDSRTIPHHWPTHSLVLGPGETRTLVIRFENQMNTLGKFVIRTPIRFAQDAGVESRIFFLYFGVVLTVIIYALLTWLVLRENIYIFYVLYLLFFNFTMMRISGHTDHFLPPELMVLPYMATPLAFLFFMLFTRQLLSEELKSRVFQWMTKGYMAWRFCSFCPACGSGSCLWTC